MLGGERERDLVGIEADHALTREHLARQRRLIGAAEDLELVVEPLQHRHDPAAGAFEERDAQVRVPLADAAEHEVADGHLEVERVGESLTQREPLGGVDDTVGETEQPTAVRHVAVR